jgi:Zn-finger nucleic acid-binding protein
MKCPNCSIDLVMSDRQGVEIDYCPTCRGVWLDRGELDKIIDKSRAAEAPIQPAPQLQQRPAGRPTYNEYGEDGEGGYRGRRRKSLLSEIFDF